MVSNGISDGGTPKVGERVLFVHAHPDDETIATGGTIALLTERGAIVTVITCTRGELGEIVDSSLAETLDLASLREAELAQALGVLGVTDHRFLGAANARWEQAPPRRYLDSGMQWGAAGAEPLDEVSPDALTSAPFAEVAADIAMVIADVRPDAVISYNARGGYGHPDHVLVGEAAARAAEVMGVPFFAIEEDGELAVDVASVIDIKRRALLSYRSQVSVGETDFAGANGEREQISTTESYHRVVAANVTVDNSFAHQTVGVKIFTIVVSAVFGAALGLVFATAHQATVVGIPWAASVGLVALALLLTGLRVVFVTRIVPLIAGVAALAASAVILVHIGGGSLLVEQNLAAWLWLIGSPVVVAAAVVWPRAARRGTTGRIETIPAVKGSSIQ